MLMKLTAGYTNWDFLNNEYQIQVNYCKKNICYDLQNFTSNYMIVMNVKLHYITNTPVNIVNGKTLKLF